MCLILEALIWTANQLAHRATSASHPKSVALPLTHSLQVLKWTLIKTICQAQVSKSRVKNLSLFQTRCSRQEWLRMRNNSTWCKCRCSPRSSKWCTNPRCQGVKPPWAPTWCREACLPKTNSALKCRVCRPSSSNSDNNRRIINLDSGAVPLLSLVVSSTSIMRLPRPTARHLISDIVQSLGFQSIVS